MTPHNLRFTGLTATVAAFMAAAPVAAQTQPPPVPPAAKAQAVPFLEAAGMSDVFEITSSQIALQKSQNPQVREFATEMIGHHTMTTNAALAAAKAGGVTPPPPVLDAAHRAMITELLSAGPANFDRVYVAQQVPSHEGALELQTAYAEGGDVASLRGAAKAAVPLVRDHLEDARRMQASMGAM